MKVVAIDRVKDAQIKYPSAHEHLLGWLQIMSHTDFYSEAELRAAFGDMRGFNFQFKFPIPESNLLVHTLINFEAQVVLVEEIKPGNI